MYVAVVDEQASSLTGFAQILRRLPDVEPICFHSPVEALHWLRGAIPVLIVVSGSLPEVNGIEFIRRLHLMPGRDEIPVIFLASKAGDRETRRTAFDLNAYAYLEKPINPSEFLSYTSRIVKAHIEFNELHDRLKDADKRASLTRGDANLPEGDDVLALQLLQATAALHDPTIAAHMDLAAKFAVALATNLHLTGEEIATIAIAARMYDIGKVAIPQRILEARIPIGAADRQSVEIHCEAGARVLAKRETPVMRAASTIAQTHHERYDGTGYPNKLRGAAIPIFGRIVAVADTLSALLRRRADRAEISLAQALDSVSEQSGLAYDPTVIAALRSGLAAISRIVHEAQLRPGD